MSDELERIAGELFQCLEQDKGPIGFLLGAGCPYSIKIEGGTPMIPDLEGLTGTVKDEVCSGDCAAPWTNICAQLTAANGCDPNIEDILSHVRASRDLAGDEEVRGVSKTMLDTVEKKICASIRKCMKKKLSDRSTPYHNLCNWVGAIERKEAVEIFTTNYDLLFEQAFEELRVPFFDGFIGSKSPFFDSHSIEYDDLPKRWARLWKLHGSINWRCGVVNGQFTIWRSNADDGGDVVIHPSYMKYEESRKMPYLALMDRLRGFLGNSRTSLITLGYSFRDQHLNDVILQSLQANPLTIAFGLLYGTLSDYPEATDIANRLSNIVLIAEDGVISGTKQTMWKSYSEKQEWELSDGFLEWIPDSDDAAKTKPKFKLGDFRNFGSFLQDISGRRSIGSERKS